MSDPLPKRMDKKTALAELRRISLEMSVDPEVAHLAADRVLMALLLDLGCRAVVVEFNIIKKYYA